MIWIILIAIIVTVLSYFMLRNKNALKIDELEDYPIEYEHRRKERSDKGKRRGKYKKGDKQ